MGERALAPPFQRIQRALWIAGAIVSSASCGTSHGADAGPGSDAARDSEVPDSSSPDVPERHVDATTRLSIVVTVVGTAGGGPLPSIPFVITGGDGFVVEGRTDDAGRISMELPSRHIPYAVTVAAERLGAQSLIDVTSNIAAVLVLDGRNWEDYGTRTSFRLTLDGLSAGELGTASRAAHSRRFIPTHAQL